MKTGIFFLLFFVLPALPTVGQDIGLDKGKAQKLLDSATRHFDLEDYDAAITQAKTAEDLYRRHGLSQGRFGANFIKTAAQLKLGYPQPLSLIDSLIQETDGIFGNVHPISAKFRQLKSEHYIKIQQFDLAETQGKEVYKIFQNTLPANHVDKLPNMKLLIALKLTASDYDSASVLAQEAIGIIETHADSPPAISSRIYHQNCAIYIRAGNYPKNLEYMLKALEVDSQTFPKDHRRMAMTYEGLAEAYFYTSNLQQAKAYFSQALDIYEQKNPGIDPSKERSFTGLGNIFNSIGKYDSALYCFQILEKIDAIKLNPNPYSTATLYANMGNTHSYLGQYLAAIEFYQKSARLLKNILDKGLPNRGSTFRRYAFVQLALANAYKNIGMKMEAEATASYTRKLQEETFGKQYVDLYRTLALLGDIAYNQKEYEKGLSYLKEGIHILMDNTRGREVPNVADMYLTIAKIYTGMANRLDSRYIKEAKNYYKKGLHIYENATPRSLVQLAQATLGLGTAYLVAEQYDSCQVYYDRGLELYAQAYGKTHLRNYQAKISYSSLLIKQKKYEEAEEMILAALESISGTLTRGNETMASTYNTLGSMHQEQANYEKSLEYYQKSLESNLLGYQAISLYESPPNASHINRFYFAQSLFGRLLALEKIYQSESNADIYTYSQAHIYVLDSLLDQEQKNIRFEKDLVSFASQAHELAERAATLALAQGPNKMISFGPENSYYFTEKAKARLLLSSMNRSQALDNLQLPQRLRTKEESLHIQMRYYEQKIANMSRQASVSDPKLLAEYQSSLFALQTQSEKFTDTLENFYPDYLRLQEQLPVAPLQKVQQILQKESTLIVSYLVGDSSIYASVIHPNAYGMLDLGTPDKLDNWIKIMRKGIVDQDQAKFSSASNYLFEKLWKPIQDRVQGMGSDLRQAIIVGDGPLHLLPFEALVNEEDSRHLIEDYAISYSPSVSMFVNQYDKKTSPSSEELLLLAPVEFDQEDSLISSLALRTGKVSLPGTRIEAERLQRVFQGKNIPFELCLHEQANERNLKAKNLSTVRYLHFATHGAADEQRPENSCLILAKDSAQIEDGILYSGEIYSLKLDADLVVLSACETGVGQLARGEGVIGLTRGFLFAGAKNVLVSLWSVQDQSTTDLVSEFYVQFLHGKSKTEALRQAKLTLMSKQKTRKPWHWAGFVLVGAGLSN